MNKKLINRSILTSIFIGLPIGLVTVFIFFEIPIILTGEGLLSMLLGGVYGKATIGLLISFLFALGFAGRQAGLNLYKNEKLLSVSFKYSILVNLLIWSTFIIITILDNLEGFQWAFLILPPLAISIFSIIGTTLSIGLLICYRINKVIKNP